MAIKDIFLLPPTLLMDIDKLLINKDITSNDIYKLIQSRFTGKINFTQAEIEWYIRDRREEINAPDLESLNVQLLPVPINMDKKLQQDVPQDKSTLVNVRNKAELLEHFKKKIIDRVGKIERSQSRIDPDHIDPYLETLVIQYTATLTKIIETEAKLQLQVEESSKLDVMVDERIGLILYQIGKVIKKNVSTELFEKIKQGIKEVFELFGINKGAKIE